MLAKLVDDVGFIKWSRTTDGADGINRPKSIVAALLQQEAPTAAVEAFDTGEGFLEAWNNINKGGEDNAFSTG